MNLTVADKVDQKLSCLKHKLEEVQRRKFHEKFPEDPALLYKELFKHKNEIDKLLSKKVINQIQHNLLFPASQQTDSTKFDATLIHVLTTNICGYQKPTTGWHNNPNPNNLSEIADLIRLKKGRNNISHLSKVQKKEHVYKGIYKSVEGAFLRLGCSQQELDEIIPLPVRFKFLPAIPTFTGRLRELQEIHQEMTSLKISGHLGLVVSTLAGIGKSELAKKYFETYRQFYDDNVVWINAELLESSFQELGSILQLNVKDQHGNYKPIEEIIALIHHYFASDKVLFIFDNADLVNKTNNQQQPTIQEEIVKYLPTSKGSSSLITSQNQFWSAQYKVYVLDPLSRDDARAFITKELNLTASDSFSVIDKIVENLGRHSLAMQQFITYVKETKISVEEYLTLLSRQPHALLFIGSRNTIASININIKKVSSNATPLTLSMLNALSFLNGKEIYRGFFLLTKFCGSNGDFTTYLIAVNEALRLFEKYSLIRLMPSNTGDSKDDVITVHSLVKETMKWIQKSKQTEIEEFQLFLGRFPLDDDDKNFQLISKVPFDKFKYWFYQLMFLHGECGEGVLRVEFLKKYSKHIMYLTDVWVHKKVSFDILKDVKNFVESNIVEAESQESQRLQNIKTLYRIECCHSAIIPFKGQFQEALEMLEVLRKKVFETFGEEDFDYLRVRNWYMTVALFTDHPESMTSVHEVCTSIKEALGDNHPLTLTSWITYARYQHKFGSNETAIACYENLMPKVLQFYEEPHPAVLSMKVAYANALYTKGKREMALNLFKNGLLNCANIYDDENHWNVVRLKNRIADAMYELSQKESALEMYKQALFGVKKYFDDTHSEVILIEERIDELSKSRKLEICKTQ